MLLKEKGFDTPTFYYYENEKLIEPYLENGSSTDTEFRVDLSDLQEHFGKWSNKVSAPTIAEVVMWLYENHGIWVSVSHKRHPENKHFSYTIKQANEIETYLWKHTSPTAAYEAAIEYCLTKLL